MYDDFRGAKGAVKVQLSGWLVGRQLFTKMARNGCKQTLEKLFLDEVIGLTGDMLENIRGASRLRFLTLRNSLDMTQAVAMVLASFPKLMELDLSDCQVDIKSMTVISQSCQLLNTLTLQNTRGLDDFCMQVLAQCMQRFRRLKKLDFSRGGDFGDEGMLSVLQAAPNLLSSLSLSAALNLTSLAITGLRTRMPALLHLDMSNFPNMTQTAFEWVAEGCRSLQTLDVRKSSNFDDAALIKIGQNCPRLERLLASKCHKLTDIGVAGFFSSHNGRLKVLDLSACIQCGGVSALAIASKGEELLDLKLNGLSQVSAAGLLALWSNTKNLVRWEMGVEMRTTVTHRKSMLPHISDEILIKANYGSMLQEVHIAGACLVGDAGACAVISKCPKLRVLDLSYCGELTDVTLIKLAAESSSTLESLAVNGCGKIRDAGVIALCKGCGPKKLKSLSLNGCSKVGDVGIQAIANFCKKMEILSISNCDSINTESMLLIVHSCRFLKSMDFSGLDLVSIDAVHALVKNCPLLTHLTCDNCNFRLNEFIAATKFSVPLAQPQITRCATEPRPRPVLEFNRYALVVQEMNVRVRVLQRFCKAIAVRTRAHRHHNNNKRAVVDIRRMWQEYQAEKSSRKDRLWRILKKRAAFIITRWAKKYGSAILQNWKKVNRLKSRDRAARTLQRTYRGHMSRRRVHTKFSRLYRFYNRIGHLVWKYTLIVEARKTARHIRKAQSVGRMFPHKLYYWLFRRAVMTLQVRFKNYYRRRMCARRIIDNMYLRMELKDICTAKIQKNWRIRQFNKQMAPYIFFCCIVWRSRDDERDWRLVMLQAWARGSIVRRRKWHTQQVANTEREAAVKISKAYRGWHSRRINFAQLSLFKNYSRFWRRVTNRCCALRLGKYTKPFQRGYKQHYFLKMRLRATFALQRVFRGFKGRQIYRAKRDFYFGIFVARVQRQFRLYKGRRFRKQVMAIEHMAAWRIQRQIHGLFSEDGMRRIKAATAARHRRELVAYKRQLLVNKWTLSLENRRRGFMDLYAGRIQKKWRSWWKNKVMRALAKETHAAAMEMAETEAALKRQGRLLAAIPNPFRPAARLAHAVGKQLMGLPLISSNDEPRLFNAVLKFHTRSIEQRGIINMKLSFGEVEAKVMEQQQVFLKTSKKPFYDLVPGDLTGPMRMHLKLWVMRGTGPDCFTQLKAQLKPESVSQPQLRSREAGASLRGERIIWHKNCHIELHGLQTIKQGKGGFAISDVVIAESEEKAEELKDKGLLLASDLAALGLPASIWLTVREPLDDSDMYKVSKIKARDWCDSRLLKALYTFNMTESDVLTLRKVYDSMLGGSDTDSLPLGTMFSTMNIPYYPDELTQWIVSAVKPLRKSELSFSEYVHVVAYFCMFAKKDLRRFVFGCMDVKQDCFLKRDKFILLVEYLAAPGVGNVTKWSLQYDKFKDRKLDSLFYGGFEKFTDVYRGIMWKTEEIQCKIRAHNLGEAYWENKGEQFTTVRRTLGVKLL